MTFINTDGMAFIGPGSEWFWTALSGIVLAITFLAIWRQLRLQSSANAREQLAAFQREWTSERFLRHRLAIIVAHRDGADPAHLPGSSVTVVCTFWSMIAELARSGHLDRAMLHHTYGTVCQSSWAVLAPQVQRWRAVDDDAFVYDTFEWLAGLMAQMDRRLGVRPFDLAILAASLPEHVAVLEDAILVEQALRTVIVASPEVAAVAQPPAPAVAEG